jgi:hypothetical protein
MGGHGNDNLHLDAVSAFDPLEQLGDLRARDSGIVVRRRRHGTKPVRAL